MARKTANAKKQATLDNPIIRHPSLKIVSDSEIRSPECLNDLFSMTVQKYASNEALKFEGKSLTYRELHHRSNQLAHHLRALGIGPEKMVAVSFERSLEMMIAIYGVIKAGGAYVPIDPTYPAERVKYMIEDSGTKVILTHNASIKKIQTALNSKDCRVINLDTNWDGQIGNESSENVNVKVDGSSLAYMIYTSGSTGNPKGVMGEHRGLVNKLLWMQNAFKLTSADRFLQKAPLSFSASLREFFWATMYGAPLILARPGGHQDSEYLVNLIVSEKITALHFVPSMLRYFLEEKDLDKCKSIKVVLCGGEALPYELQQKFFSKIGAELHNAYGPTEATVAASYWKCEKDGALKIVPVGVPVADTRLYVLDENLKPVPPGTTGELYIAGSLVGRGYYNRPELTAEKFLVDSYSNEKNQRMYGTGDLARQVSDGIIEYLGRKDFQVKIRGNRVEPGEIESALMNHANVKQAVVLPKEMKNGSGLNLVAYMAVRKVGTSVTAYRETLQNRVPDYMVPALFVEMEDLPLLPNGKVDRNNLMQREDSPQGRSQEYVAPRNEIEKKICNIWEKILCAGTVGITDNFFELGGDSIQMMRIVQQLKAAGVEAEATEIQRCTTVASMSEFLELKSRPQSSAPTQPAKPRIVTLTHLQKSAVKSLYLEKYQGFIRWHEVGHSGQRIIYLPGLSMPAVGGFLAVASNPNMRDTVGVMIDFFGSGTSDHVEQFSYTPEAHAECVAAVMDHLRCGPCPVVGHSMGGTVAIALGLQRPDLVSQLVIAEGNITPGGGFLTTEIAALPVEEFCTKVFPDVLKARREAAIAGDPHAAFVAGGWAHIDPRALHGNSRATVHLAEDFAARFLALKTPRTFVFGEMTYPKTAQEVTADAPDPGMLSAAGVSIAIVPGVGHNLQVGNPEGFVTVLRKALGLE